MAKTLKNMTWGEISNKLIKTLDGMILHKSTDDSEIYKLLYAAIVDKCYEIYQRNVPSSQGSLPSSQTSTMEKGSPTSSAFRDIFLEGIKLVSEKGPVDVKIPSGDI